MTATCACAGLCALCVRMCVHTHHGRACHVQPHLSKPRKRCFSCNRQQVFFLSPEEENVNFRGLRKPWFKLKPSSTLPPAPPRRPPPPSDPQIRQTCLSILPLTSRMPLPVTGSPSSHTSKLLMRLPPLPAPQLSPSSPHPLRW